MMTNYRTRIVANDPSMGEKKKKIALEGGQSATIGNISSGPYTRTKSQSHNQGTSRFIMEDLEKINRTIIQKNTELMHSLS